MTGVLKLRKPATDRPKIPSPIEQSYALHHLEHVLRVDHGGWPFLPQVTPFTFSLLVYPVLLAAFLAARRPLVRTALLACVLVAVQAAHVLVEIPVNQFETWTTGSTAVCAPGQLDLFGISSPLLGAVAVVVSLGLSVALLAAVVSAARDLARSSAHRPIATA